MRQFVLLGTKSRLILIFCNLSLWSPDHDFTYIPAFLEKFDGLGKVIKVIFMANMLRWEAQTHQVLKHALHQIGSFIQPDKVKTHE